MLHCERGHQPEHTPSDKCAVFTTCGSGWVISESPEVPPPKPEVRVQNSDIECQPRGIENILRIHAVDAKAVIGVEQLPRKVQRQRIERNRVGLVTKADANAVDINNRPAD